MPAPKIPDPDFFLGLDLGQAQNYTALAALERSWRLDPDLPEQLQTLYALKLLRRWHLGTSYTTVVREVAELVARPPLNYPILGVDGTGVGRAVVNMFREVAMPARLKPVVITGGHAVTLDDEGALHVPKKELVSVIQMLLQARRLKIAAVPEREILVKELSTFKVKITVSANETYEAWRDKDTDDMVLATGIAAWLGERAGHPVTYPESAPEAEPGWARMDNRERREQSAAERRGLFGMGGNRR